MAANPALKLFSLFKRHRLTPDEIAERKATRALTRQLRELTGKLQNEAEEYARVIPLVLKDLGIYSKKRIEIAGLGNKPIRETITKRVRFMRPFVVNEEAIYLRVDLRPGRRPEGVTWRDLADEDTLRDIGGVIGHKTDARYDEQNGLRYVIWRDISARGVPLHVQFDQIWALKPASANRYSYPLGMTEGKRIIWPSLPDQQGVIIAGTTGGGKTNLIKVIVTSLIAQNTERTLQLIIADFKLVEFHVFKGLPHLIKYDIDRKGEWVTREVREAYITEPEHMLPALRYLKADMEHRAKMIEQDDASNIVEYNRGRREKRMAHTVLVIDELAELILHPKYSAECQELIVNIGSKGRAMGIHLVMGTQHPSSKIIEGRLKTVMPAIVAFPMPTISASVMVLGHKGATEISEHGRCIYQFGLEKFEVQVPLISNEKVREIVYLAKAGDGYKAEIKDDSDDVTDQEMFEWAVKDNNFKLDWRAVVAKFSVRGMMEWPVKKRIKGYLGKQVNVNGEDYEIVPGGHSDATRLVKIEDINNASGSVLGAGSREKVEPSVQVPAVTEPESVADVSEPDEAINQPEEAANESA